MAVIGGENIAFLSRNDLNFKRERTLKLMPTMGACWRIRIPAESEGTALNIAYSFVFVYFMATKSFAVGAYLK